MALSFPPQLTGDNSRDIIAIQSYLFDLLNQFDSAVGTATGVVDKAPLNAEYVVGAVSTDLTAERLLTDTATIVWDVTTASQVKADIPDDAVTTAKLASDAVSTVKIANDAVTAIKVATDAITTIKIADDAVTYAKLQNVTASRVLGRGSASGSGDANELTVGTGLDLTGTVLSSTVSSFTTEDAQDAVGAMIDGSLVYVDATPLLTRAALTGDIAASQGSNTTALGSNVVTDAKLRQGVGVSVVGRSANSTGNVADIVAATDSHVLRRLASVVGFGLITTASLSDYVEGSFTITGTGFTVNPTGTARYVKVGNLVVLNFPVLSGTSNATTLTLTGLPAGITPTRNSHHLVFAIDNSVQLIGLLLLTLGSTTITVYANIPPGVWTNSGTKTFPETTVTYLLT